MDLTFKTNEELIRMRKDILLQQQALETLDDMVIREEGKRYGHSIAIQLQNLIN